MFRDLKTPIACVQSELPSFAQINRKFAAALRSSMMLWLDDIQGFFNVSTKMSPAQAMQTCDLILEDFWMLNFADLNLIAKRAKKGEYGQLFGMIDGQIVYGWFAAYFSERATAAADRSIHEAHEQESDLSAIPADVRKKILEAITAKKPRP